MTTTTYKLDLKREHQTYRNRAGQKLPGVTTVLGVVAKHALMGWYADQERAGVVEHVRSVLLNHDEPYTLDLIEFAIECLPKGRFAEAKRDKAADLGTIAHARCEAFLRGMEFDPDGLPEDLYRASSAPLERFQNWWAQHGFTVVHTELQMAHEALGYGGTADIIARDRDGGLCLIDLKTTRASRQWPYDETIAQVAAYAELYEAQDMQPLEAVHLFRIGKTADDEGQIYTVPEAQLEAGLHMFVAALRLYQARQEVKR